jgi:hypothetical protein
MGMDMTYSEYWFYVYHPSKKGKQAKIGPFITRHAAEVAAVYYKDRAGKVFKKEKPVYYQR